MSKPYFIRVTEQSPTMFWINNPTREQADWAIEHGALGCTNNPAYTSKMINKKRNAEEAEYALGILDEVLRDIEDDRHAAVEFQARMVRPIAEKFLPMYESSGYQHGYVSIQGDPIDDEDVEFIIKESLDNRKVAPNICCKIPATEAGIAAMEELITQDVPLNATEIFGVSQLIAVCETYERVARKTGKYPKLYVSHIAGIYDDELRAQVQEKGIDVSEDLLVQAGLATARRVYHTLMERGYNATFIGGGARSLHHFTEMVGGRVCITINWVGSADKLIEQNPPVVYRLFNPVPAKVIDELCEKLPDFKKGWLEDGLTVEEFGEFAPVQRFRNAFLTGWYEVLEAIKERRAVLA